MSKAKFPSRRYSVRLHAHFARLSEEGHSSWLRAACESGSGLVEIDDFAVQAELVKLAAGCFNSTSGIEAAGLQGVEAGNADQTLDGGRGDVVARGVKEYGSTWLSKCCSRQSVRGESPKRPYAKRLGRRLVALADEG